MRARRCSCTVSIAPGCAPTASDCAAPTAAATRHFRSLGQACVQHPRQSGGAMVHLPARSIVPHRPHDANGYVRLDAAGTRLRCRRPANDPPEHHAKSRDSARLQDVAAMPALRSPPPPKRRHRAGRSIARFHLKVSFFALKSAKVAMSGARRNGLAASSLAIVDGTVGCPPAR
jgi:hypothetical protein